jgi:hypothetical protein
MPVYGLRILGSGRMRRHAARVLAEALVVGMYHTCSLKSLILFWCPGEAWAPFCSTRVALGTGPVRSHRQPCPSTSSNMQWPIHTHAHFGTIYHVLLSLDAHLEVPCPVVSLCGRGGIGRRRSSSPPASSARPTPSRVSFVAPAVCRSDHIERLRVCVSVDVCVVCAVNDLGVRDLPSKKPSTAPSSTG